MDELEMNGNVSSGTQEELSIRKALNDHWNILWYTKENYFSRLLYVYALEATIEKLSDIFSLDKDKIISILDSEIEERIKYLPNSSEVEEKYSHKYNFKGVENISNDDPSW